MSQNPEKMDIILCGVGGQGVLSLAAILSRAAQIEGLHVRQSEVHGMAQRGGAVLAHFRMSAETIPGDLIPRGGADMILSMEPLEALRYTDYLKPEGVIVTSRESFKNITQYPEEEGILKALADLDAKVVPAKELARKAGAPRGVNMVMVGAASTQFFLPSGKSLLSGDSLQAANQVLFAPKGEAVVTANQQALLAGAQAADGGAEASLGDQDD